MVDRTKFSTYSRCKRQCNSNNHLAKYYAAKRNICCEMVDNLRYYYFWGRRRFAIYNLQSIGRSKRFQQGAKTTSFSDKLDFLFSMVVRRAKTHAKRWHNNDDDNKCQFPINVRYTRVCLVCEQHIYKWPHQCWLPLPFTIFRNRWNWNRTPFAMTNVRNGCSMFMVDKKKSGCSKKRLSVN